MFRNLIALFSVIIIIGGSFAGYLLYKDMNNPISKAIMAVPSNASIVIECRDFPSLWNKLKKQTSFWNHLSNVSFVKSLNQNTFYLDSIFAQEGKIASIIKNRSTIVSAHITGTKSFNYLFLVSLKNNNQMSDVDRFISSIKNNNIKKRMYEKVEIREFSLKENASFSFAFCKGVFICSFSSGLVEDAIRQLNSGNSLLNNSINPGFEIVQVTADKKSDCNIYLNYSTLPKLLALFSSLHSSKNVTNLNLFANWSELDVKIKDDGLMLNGLTHPNDSSNKYLNLFVDQKAPSVEMPYIFPDNTLLFYHLGISNFKKYYNDYKTYLDEENQLFDYEKAISDLETNNEISNIDEITSILGNEFAFIKTGISLPLELTKKKTVNEFVIIKIKGNDSTFVKALCSSGQKTQLKNSEKAVDNELSLVESKPIYYRSYPIYKTFSSKLWSVLLKGVFENSKANYFTIINNYAVFGEDINGLRSFIGSFISGRTLKTDLGYTSFSENISSNSNLYFYYNIPICLNTGTLQSSLSKSLKKEILLNLDTLKQIQAIAGQITNGSTKKILQKGNLFYTTLNIKHNPKYQEKKQLFTQAKLDAPLERKPWIVKNHYTGESEIFIQDNKNNIYLIGLGGNIIWKKELDSPIIGKVNQIDIYKNKKLQLLFNTSTSIYLLDRKGENVEKYPINLPAKATNGLTVMDYDKNKKYRLLIACENKLIYNYDKYGKQVKGWEMGKMKSIVRGEISHISIRGKDYVIIIDEGGNLYSTDRRGGKRKYFNSAFPNSCQPSHWITKANNIGNTTIMKSDSIGKIFSINFKGTKDSLIVDEFSSDTKTKRIDINKDGKSDYLFLDKNELVAYNDEKELIFNESFDIINPLGPYVFVNSGEIKIGVGSKEEEEIYLYNSIGEIIDGFPLYGNSPFILFSTNNSQLIATGVPGNFLYIYTVE